MSRLAVRRAARYFPDAYNWRNQHNVLLQRLRGGVHDPDFEVLRNLDIESPMVVDVGANTGQSIQTVKTLLPGARILSVEPSPIVIARLVRFASTFSDVEIGAFAAAESFQVRTLFTPVVRKIVFTQWASLAEPSALDICRSLVDAGFGPTEPEEVTFHRARCIAAPLDQVVVDGCDVLKVDVEGYEEGVIRGAVELIRGSLPMLILERPTVWLATMLRTWGYRELEHASAVNSIFVHPDRPRGMNVGTVS